MVSAAFRSKCFSDCSFSLLQESESHWLAFTESSISNPHCVSCSIAVTYDQSYNLPGVAGGQNNYTSGAF